jgi:two-component system, OmpR family, response regulator
MPHCKSRHILLIEDDPQITEFLCQGLRENRFKVDAVQDGIEGLELALQGTHCAVILDLMLPGMDGLELLQRMRARNVDTPVLILSAKRKVDDRVLGLRAGGDDYLVKPFVFAELLARIESLLRRANGRRDPVKLRVSDLTLDLLARCAYLGKKKLELQPQEFNILEYLMRNRGQVVTRTQILQQALGYKFSTSTNVIEVHICHLREKIERPDKPKFLKTVRGVGYMLGEDEHKILP